MSHLGAHGEGTAVHHVSFGGPPSEDGSVHPRCQTHGGMNAGGSIRGRPDLDLHLRRGRVARSCQGTNRDRRYVREEGQEATHACWSIQSVLLALAREASPAREVVTTEAAASDLGMLASTHSFVFLSANIDH